MLMNLAIAFFAIGFLTLMAIYCSVNIADEMVRISVVLPTLFCLFLSLVFAPWSIQLLIVIALLVSKQHTNALVRVHLGVAENQCFAYKKHPKTLPFCNPLEQPRRTCDACLFIGHFPGRNDCFLHY